MIQKFKGLTISFEGEYENEKSLKGSYFNSRTEEKNLFELYQVPLVSKVDTN